MSTATISKSVKPSRFDEAVPVGKIRRAPYNPASRVSKARLTKLLADIEESGQIFVPLIMTSAHELIDGHRRLACAELLEMKTVPAVIREMTPEERQRAYASINSTSQSMRSSDALQVWLRSPDAIPATRAMAFEAMQARLGRPMVKKMADKSYSPYLYTLAIRIAGYCGIDSDAFIKKTVAWLMSHNAQSQVRMAMTMDQPASTLARAIERNQTLRMKVVAE